MSELTGMDVHNCIRYLKPNTKFMLLHSPDRKEYHGINEPIDLGGKYLLDWFDKNNPPPTWDEILACDIEAVREEFAPKEPQLTKAEIIEQIRVLTEKVVALEG